MSGLDLVKFYKNLGFAGLIVTDHFFTGNSSVPREMPWEERVDIFCSGYDEAYEAGQEYGMDVFFAWEFTYQNADFLTYGLDKQWLYDHSDMEKWEAKEYFDITHADGAFIVHAHPFRQAAYITGFHLFPELTDAVEVINSSMPDIVNERAEWYANEYNLLKIVGSDTHYKERKYLSAMIYNTRLDNMQDFIERTINGEFTTENIYL
ncbi:MAG: histidinol phosphatase [Oscillospiraceae bacterium]|nr:histidinol phosphatase [Oscillospiraceae bacterium]